MGISGVNTGVYNYNGGYVSVPYQSAALNPSLLDNTGIIVPTSGNQAYYRQQANGCTDDKDDGKIGFWKAAGHLLKGAWNFIKSPFCDENGNFSIKQTLKSALTAVGIAAATAIPVIGPLVVPTLLATGITVGTLGTVGSIANILTAGTDAEAKAAWESLGKNGTALGLSVFGAKRYASAKAGHSVSIKDGVKQVFKEPYNAVRDGVSSLKNASLGTIAQKTGVDRLINGIRPTAPSAAVTESTTGAAGSAAGTAAGSAGTTAGTTARTPLFGETRQWIYDKYQSSRGLTLGELTSNAYNSGKTWAINHGFQNNIRDYKLPFTIAAYDALS